MVPSPLKTLKGYNKKEVLVSLYDEFLRIHNQGAEFKYLYIVYAPDIEKYTGKIKHKYYSFRSNDHQIRTKDLVRLQEKFYPTKEFLEVIADNQKYIPKDLLSIILFNLEKF